VLRDIELPIVIDTTVDVVTEIPWVLPGRRSERVKRGDRFVDVLLSKTKDRNVEDVIASSAAAASDEAFPAAASVRRFMGGIAAPNTIPATSIRRFMSLPP
jgi:hypothetical protein